MTEPIYDVIVIGTGMGGSACGALSARAGLKTLILEKNPRIGGACSYYEKDGFHVDFGTHLFTCGGEGAIGEVLRRVGARSRVEFVQLRRFSRILGLDMNIPLYNSLLSIFRTSYRIHHQLGIRLREMPDVVRLNYNFFRMPDEDIEKWDDRTMEEYVMQYSQNPGLMAITNVVLALYFVYPYWKTSAGEGAWASKAMIKAQAISYPKGGAVIVHQTMLDAAKDRGATVLTQARVRKILVEKGAACGVELEDGRKFLGRAVVSNGSLKDTVFNLVGAQHFPEDYRKMTDGLEQAHNAVQFKIALDRKVIKEGSLIVLGSPHGDFRPKTTTVPQVHRVYEDLLSGRLPELVPLYLVVPSNFDPSLAPPGKQIIILCTGAPLTTSKWVDPPEVWEEAMMKALREAIPGIERHILWKEVVGAKAIESWIGKTGGSCVSTAQVPGQVGKKRPAIRSPLPGLYFAGDQAGGRGIGTELAARSGMECAEILDSDFRNGRIS
ncbi:MAG: NAD(P)/FAD-dependent oxidoreductase [bacterium]|nr:NAD(P)/FAD-dependent oxidoreductase [bacterium]